MEEPLAREVGRPPLQVERDPRPFVHKPRGASLLKAEIQQLKALLELTPRESTERPRIIRRLADVNAELAWAAPRESESARIAAIQYYTMLAKQHKDHCGSPPGKKCADEALYFMALEWELFDKPEEARKSYLSLVQHYPQSIYVPYAYFAFGELFFKEAMRQDLSKLSMARQIYEKVIQFRDSPIAAHATLRLAEIAEAEGKKEEAEQHRKRAAAMRPQGAPGEPNPAPR
jgi:TolA-binding protein